jgi:predicted DNA binding CopG/RHH family protein
MTHNKLQLDEEELQILRDFERGEFKSIKNFREEKRQLEAAAGKTLQKDKRLNIRLSARDLEKLQKRAATEGLSYQTLIASTLHKFVTGQLKKAKEDQ